MDSPTNVRVDMVLLPLPSASYAPQWAEVERVPSRPRADAPRRARPAGSRTPSRRRVRRLSGANADDAAPLEHQRHTGAGGLVGSGAEEHHVGIARDGVVVLVDLLDGHHPGAGDAVGRRLDLDLAPQVDDLDVRAPVEPALELLGLDPARCAASG